MRRSLVEEPESLGVRAFYLCAAFWFARRAVLLVTATLTRPGSIRYPADWVATLTDVLPWSIEVLFAAASAVSASVGSIAVFMARSVGLAPRVAMFGAALFVNTLDHSYGVQSHWNHVLLLGLLYGSFVQATPLQPEQHRWFRIGLVIPYGFAGFWKLRHAVAAIGAEGVDGTWLEADALRTSAEVNSILLERPVPGLWLAEVGEPFMPVLFVVSGGLLLVVPIAMFVDRCRGFVAIGLAGFHWLNWWALGADFRFIGVVLLLSLFPYESLDPWLRRIAGPDARSGTGVGSTRRGRRRRAGSDGPSMSL